MVRFSGAVCAVLLACGSLLAPGCSLGNISNGECVDDTACAQAFGVGSACVEGFCTEPATCNDGHDCRTRFGGGVCVEGACVDSFPKDPQQCPTNNWEPSDLPSLPLSGPDAPVVIGGVFSLGEAGDLGKVAALRLAVREINDTGGLAGGRKIGLVVCDNGGPSNEATGTEREDLNKAAVDFLAGDLGVPLIVGPATSEDALTMGNHVIGQGYPTAIISPSATSPQLSKLPDRLEEGDPYGLFWRIAPSDTIQGQVLAENVVGQLPVVETIGKVSVVFIQDAYGQGLSTVFQENFSGETSLHPFDSDSNATTLAADVASEAPDGVLIIAVKATDTVLLLESMALEPTLADKRFYFSDGSKETDVLLDQSLSSAAQAILANAVGTAPAEPSGANYSQFEAALNDEFSIDAASVSFAAHSYDAGYVGAYGIAFAMQLGLAYDGRHIAEGLSLLSSGTQVDVGSVDWLVARDGLTGDNPGIDITGTSGPLDFNAEDGEAPGAIEVWQPNSGLTGFDILQIVAPPSN